jgi:hypothetical protein
MIADADMNVWLETLSASQPSVIVPYVQSAADKNVKFRVKVVREGSSGRSEISQGGALFVPASKAMALGRMSVNVGAQDNCHIEVTFTEAGKPAGEYRFDCPR